MKNLIRVLIAFILMCGTCYAQNFTDSKMNLEGKIIETVAVDGGTLVLVEYSTLDAWAVYALQKTTDDPQQVINNGFILPLKFGCDVYPERNTWTYITPKQLRQKQ